MTEDEPWTPTTEEVRESFASDYWEVEVRGHGTPEEVDARRAAFDRWLATL